MPTSLWTETATFESVMTGVLGQAAELRTVRTSTNQMDFRSVFWNTASTSKMEARIGWGRGYLNAVRMAKNSFAGDEITASASNG
jgi:hypothetical protein